QPEHLPARQGEVRRAEGDRAGERPAQPGALRPPRHLADRLGHARPDGADRARGARARPRPPAGAAQGEPRDRRGADPERRTGGGQARGGARPARRLPADFGHAQRPLRDRRRLDRAAAGRPGSRHTPARSGRRVAEGAAQSSMKVLGVTLALLAAALPGAACGQSATPSQTASRQVHIRQFASGFDSPLYVTATKSEPGNLYVVEQPGVIRVIQNGTVRPQPFLDIRSRVTAGGEQGLLSMAFDPNYKKNHRFFVYFNDRSGDVRVFKFRSNG